LLPRKVKGRNGDRGKLTAEHRRRPDEGRSQRSGGFGKKGRRGGVRCRAKGRKGLVRLNVGAKLTGKGSRRRRREKPGKSAGSAVSFENAHGGHGQKGGNTTLGKAIEGLGKKTREMTTPQKGLDSNN